MLEWKMDDRDTLCGVGEVGSTRPTDQRCLLVRSIRGELYFRTMLIGVIVFHAAPVYAAVTSNFFEHTVIGCLGVISLVLLIVMGALLATNRRRKAMGKALIESEERFRMLYERAPLGYQSLDINGNFLEVNQAWLDLLGYTREEVIGRHFTEFMTRECATLVQERFPKFKATGSIQNALFDMVRKDGSHVIASIDGKIGYDLNGNFKQTHCILHDVTETTKTREALEESEHRFREMAEHIDDFYWLWDRASGKIIYVNPAYEKIVGRSIDDFYRNPNHFYDFVYPADKDKAMAHYDRGMFDPTLAEAEYRLVRPDGSIRWIHSNIYPISGKQGDVYRACGTARDITDQKLAEEKLQQINEELEQRVEIRTSELAAANEDLRRQIEVRRQAEQALRNTENRFSRVFDQLPIGLIILNSNGEIVSANTAFCRMLGFASSDVKGKHGWDMIHSDDVENSRTHIEQLLAGQNNHFTIEQRYVANDQRTLWVKLTATAMSDDKLSPRFCVCMIEDVTELKQALSAAQRNERLASIGTLAAGIAHEINNPLGAIMMAAHLARSGKDGNDTTDEMLDLIVADTKRCSKIVKSVLQFARDNQFDKEMCDIAIIATRAKKIIEDELETGQAEIKLITRGDLPVITANPEGIQQAMVHILQNSIDADAQHIEISLEADKKLLMYKITIIDDGHGIEDEQLKHAFDPFFTDKPSSNSSGLGLSITHGIVVAHGGSIDLYQNPDRGVTVVMELPVTTYNFSEIKDEL